MIRPAGSALAALLVAGSFGSLAAEGGTDVTPLRQAIAGAVDSAQKSQTISVRGADGWFFLDQELRHLIAPKFWSDNGAPVPGDPLPAILDFKEQLDLAGVDLLMVPVPGKCAIYPDKLSLGASPPQKIAETDRAFYQVLGEHGIKVLDLTDTFLAARANLPAALYCQQDSHWSPAGLQVAAKEIALRLQDLPWVKNQPKVPMKSAPLPLAIQGDLAPPGTPPEATEARSITSAASGQPVLASKESPVILLGDSHNLIFHAGGDMQSVGAGLPDQLAFELGFPVDVVAVRGSGATPARRNLARRKDNLAGRRLIIWCFSSREFTEGQGWSKVPVVKPPAQSGP